VTVAAASTVLIESATTGESSAVQFTGGTALTALGKDWESPDPCATRPTLGVGDASRNNKDAITLRRCGCGTYDVLHRTWDVAPRELAGTAFYEHRKAVNFLAAHFKANGWITPGVSAAIGAENATPTDRFPEAWTLINVPKF
jgi:hypothetical protein